MSAAGAAGGEGVEIGLPQRVPLAPEAVEVLPGVDAGIMQVIELQAHGVVADRLDLHDADMAAPGDDLLLARPVALHLGRGALPAQELGRIAEGLAGVEAKHTAHPPP